MNDNMVVKKLLRRTSDRVLFATPLSVSKRTTVDGNDIRLHIKNIDNTMFDSNEGHSIKIFYSHADAIVLVYDIYDKSSLTDVLAIYRNMMAESTKTMPYNVMLIGCIGAYSFHDRLVTYSEGETAAVDVSGELDNYMTIRRRFGTARPAVCECIFKELHMDSVEEIDLALSQVARRIYNTNGGREGLKKHRKYIGLYQVFKRSIASFVKSMRSEKRVGAAV